eukprot:TRINITY_DN96116_c0_g1_i1.p1 TRINITY_DN96116_c0_g1~~TRINITY_DN96116_c0_g1_i1.p1  ORF type:complete len:253 (+),score=82.15 TRINITY_DN96116_c0_g1_i1:82-840(+)
MAPFHYRCQALLLLVFAGAAAALEAPKASRSAEGAALVQTQAVSSKEQHPWGTSIGEAVSQGYRRTPVVDLEAVDQHRSRPVQAVDASLPTPIQGRPSAPAMLEALPESSFSMLKLKKLKEAGSRVMSLVAAGARAAAESAAPSMVKAASSSDAQKVPKAKAKPASLSATGLFGQVQKQDSAAPVAMTALQREVETVQPVLKVQKLESKQSATEEALRAAERAKQQHEAEEQQRERDLEDTMDVVRNNKVFW